MKPSQLTLAIAIGLSLTACDQAPTGTDTSLTTTAAQQVTQAATDTSEVMATVNGTAITKNLLDTYMEQRQRRRPEGANIEGVIEELINLELTVQDGISQGIDKNEMVVAQIEQQRKAVIAGATIKKMLTDKPITEAELQALYTEKTGATSGKEYKARHILVKTEQEANDIIAKLEIGGDFSELAKEFSTGPTGKNGGDLGWFSAAQMVQPFSDAVAALEKGTYTKTPVQTQFGWHVIIHDDNRDIEPPPFDQLKPQLEAYIQKERLQNYLDGLKEKANVVIQYKPAPAMGMGHSEHDDHSHGSDEVIEPAIDTSAAEAVEKVDTATDGAVEKATDMVKDAAGTATEAAKDIVESATDAVKDAAGSVTGDSQK